MPEENNLAEKNELFWSRCQVWGTGRLYRSSAVVIPAGLARRFGIKSGDTLIFKEDLDKHRIIIEVEKSEKKGGKK